jgi:hypothetical protein
MSGAQEYLFLIPAIPALLAVGVSYLGIRKTKEIHLMINSRMDAWMKVTAEQATQKVEAEKLLAVAAAKAEMVIAVAQAKADAVLAAAAERAKHA